MKLKREPPPGANSAGSLTGGFGTTRLPNTVFLEPAMKVSTWRSLWPSEELRRRGHDVTTYSADARTRGEIIAGRSTVVVHITAQAWARTADKFQTPAMLVERVRQVARTLVLSFDDDLLSLWHITEVNVPEVECGAPLPSGNRCTKARDHDDDHGLLRRINTEARLLMSEIPLICRMASAIVVTTPRLADVFGRYAARTYVAENYLPERYVRMPLPRKRIRRLAWMGGLDVHGNVDLPLLEPFAKDLPPMLLIGTGKEGWELLTEWGATDVVSTEVHWKQKDLYRIMAEPVAAIVPLAPDNRFNLGKSWIKPYEFMARGVPVVASEHPEYRRLAMSLTVPPLYDRPEDLVAGAWWAFESGNGAHLPGRILDAGFTMERKGGDAWETALSLT
jgi:hypothetical protein